MSEKSFDVSHVKWHICCWPAAFARAATSVSSHCTSFEVVQCFVGMDNMQRFLVCTKNFESSVFLG